MALPLIGLTVLTGYLLSGNENDNVDCKGIAPRNALVPNDLPNGKNIYSSNVVNEADYAVLQKSIQNYTDSQDPAITGMLPPIFNTYSANGNLNVLTNTTTGNYPMDTFNSLQMNNLNELNKRTNVLQSNEKNIIISKRPMFNPVFASREETDTNEIHGVLYNASQGNLQINPLTGIPYENIHKNMTPFFGGALKQNVESLTNTATLDLYTGNRDTFKHKKEVGPFYTLQKQDIHGTPSVSVNTDISRYIPSNYKQNEKPFYEERIAAPISGTIDNKIRDIPLTVDELRYASKPKLSYEGRTLSGQFANVRGYQAPVKKNLVNRYYDNTPDMWLKTKAAITGDTPRDRYVMKATSRQDTSNESYVGPSYASSQKKTQQRTVNAGDCKNESNANISDSMVQKSIRQSLKPDYVRNVNFVKKSDIEDDYGKDGYTPRLTERFVNGETNQFDLNVNVQNRGQQKYYVDDAKSTIKQSTLYADHSGNVKTSFDKGAINAFEKDIQHWDAKATNKQALINNKYIGGAKRDEGMGYVVTKYDAKTTGKEIITENSNYVGNANRDEGLGYVVSKYDAKTTSKEIITENSSYIGTSTPVQKNTISRNNYNNAEINDRQEVLISNSRASGPSIFQIAGGSEIQGNFKYTDRMALKEETSYRKIQDQNEFLNPILPHLTTPVQNIGFVENKNQTEAEEENNRLVPELILHQLQDNPFYINTQGKI